MPLDVWDTILALTAWWAIYSMYWHVHELDKGVTESLKNLNEMQKAFDMRMDNLDRELAEAQGVLLGPVAEMEDIKQQLETLVDRVDEATKD